jgi:transposase-like protein
MSKRRRYDDKFRANSVVTLEAAGYPGKEGALTMVAKHIGIPRETLRRWAIEKNNPAPPELVTEKKAELIDLYEAELRAIFGEMPKARPGANYKDLGTVAGILTDKLQLLLGKPTWRGEIVSLIKEGKISPQEVMDEFSDAPELAQEFIESAGLQFAGIREAETESATANSEASAG